MSELLHLEHVQKWVGDGEARLDILKGVNLTLPTGVFVAIMGASGSGKSTLMNLIGLLDAPSAGFIRLMGQDVSTLSDDAAAHLRARSIGFVFQSFHLLPYLTARENVELPMNYGGRYDTTGRSLALLEKMKLGHRADAYPKTLSGGEKQRVAIARALANEPSLILADEPTGSLDSRTGADILDILGQLHRSGVSVVLVTHDETIARRAQRVLHMKDGRFE